MDEIEEIHHFTERVSAALLKENVEELKKLYTTLSESNDINYAKLICISLYENCYDNIMGIIRNTSPNVNLQYCCWHFLQLMTTYSKVKNALEADRTVIPLLMKFNENDMETQEMNYSLKTITLNYVVYLLGGASDDFYDHVAETKTISFIHMLLTDSILSPHDDRIEPLLLCMNLLIEGSSSCKSQLNNMKFDELLAQKIQERQNCNEELLKIANLTYQKCILLRNNDKQFAEDFRKNYNAEAEKQVVYQPLRCSNTHCLLVEEDLMQQPLKRCSKCKQATYCSKECQVTHWKESHSKICKTLVM